MDDLISRLSEIRSEYNCFDENEEPYYRALSEAITILYLRADGDTISRQAAIDAIESAKTARTPDGEIYVAKLNAEMNIQILPSTQPQYEELTPEEVASEIASGCIMSASYWLAAMIRLKPMGYAICKKKG